MNFKTKKMFALNLSLGFSLSLMACSPTQPIQHFPVQSNQAHQQQNLTQTVHLNYQGVTGPAGLRTQAIDPSVLKFVQATLVGEQLSSPISSAVIPVTGPIPPISFNHVPRASGALRLITVQGFDAAMQPLTAFKAAGYFRSSAQAASVQVAVNRRQLLTSLALQELLNNNPTTLNSIDLGALQTSIDAATGYNSVNKSFTQDPSVFNPQALASLLLVSPLPSAAEVIAAAQVSLPQPGLQLSTTLGGNFAEVLTVRINDPLSTLQTVHVGSQSPFVLNTGQVSPGDWELTVKRSDGSLVDSAEISVSDTGALTLSKSNLTAAVTETPVITSMNISDAILGSTLTLTGRGFSPTLAENKIYLGQELIIPSSGSSTSLTLTVPALALGYQPVTVQLGEQISSSQPLMVNLSVSGLSTLAGNPIQGNQNGPLASASFYNPNRLTMDPQGNLYISESGNLLIRKITPTGIVSTLAGNGSPNYVDGPAATAEFGLPHDLLMDPNGNLLVADGGNHAIRKITPDGEVSTLAGNGNFGFDNGPALSATFNAPVDMVYDANGNLLIADRNNSVIRKLSPDGQVSTYAGTGNIGSDDGDLSSASFNQPTGLVLDNQGNLFVADQSNHNIRKITPDGQVMTFAGSTSGASGYQDDLGTAALFNTPNSITIDNAGVLYVADYFNSVVRKITADGQVTTLAGNGNFGYVDGPPLSAEFSGVSDLQVDANGILYVADASNNCIRYTTR